MHMLFDQFNKQHKFIITCILYGTYSNRHHAELDLRDHPHHDYIRLRFIRQCRTDTSIRV